jgi:hypothetical protein
MNYDITPRSARLVRNILSLVREMDDSVLAGASAEARAEWTAFIDRLPTAGDLRRGVVAFDENESERLLAKAMRFREILLVVAVPVFRISPSRALSPSRDSRVLDL